MTDTHPLRIAADTVDANVTDGGVTETFLDALKKRTSLVLTPTETLSTFNFATGSPPYSVIYGQTGYVYFYNPDDTTTPDDGSTCLVSADGRRYILADMSAMAISSVLASQNSPPVSPTDGDAYIVGTSPTGAWVGHAKDVALYTPRGWVFATPKVGTALLNQTTSGNLQYNAAGSWAAMPTSIAASGVTPSQMLFPMGLSVEAQQNAPPGSPVAGDGLYYLVGTSPSGAWSGHSNDIATYDLTSTWVFLDAYDGAMIFNKASDAQLTWFDATGDWRPVWPIAAVTEGRLTVVTGTPVPVGDQTAKATIYFTPYRGKNIALYVNGGWAMRQFAELSLSLSGFTVSKNFDVFAYDNSGTVAIESLVWTNDTTRATAIAFQDGIPVKSGDATRKYLGTFYTTATGQTEDSAAKRMVWNYWNRTRRSFRKTDLTGGYTFSSTGGTRQMHANAANQCEFVIGLAVEEVKAMLFAAVLQGGSISMTFSFGLDSTTVSASEQFTMPTNTTALMTVNADYGAVVAPGRHTLVMLESSTSAGTNMTIAATFGMTGTVAG